MGWAWTSFDVNPNWSNSIMSIPIGGAFGSDHGLGTKVAISNSPYLLGVICPCKSLTYLVHGGVATSRAWGIVNSQRGQTPSEKKIGHVDFQPIFNNIHEYWLVVCRIHSNSFQLAKQAMLKIVWVVIFKMRNPWSGSNVRQNWKVPLERFL